MTYFDPREKHLRPVIWILAARSQVCFGRVAAVEPMNVGFLWHMHQPTYYPGETITQTDAQYGSGVGAVSSSNDIHPESASTAVPEPSTNWSVFIVSTLLFGCI